jgi:hypothetical protein
MGTVEKVKGALVEFVQLKQAFDEVTQGFQVRQEIKKWGETREVYGYKVHFTEDGQNEWEVEMW